MIKSTINKIRRSYWKRKAIKVCKNYVEPLRVNAKTILTKNTYLGKNVNFNGMAMKGNGVIKIGNNFHSGQHCSIITSFHQYDFGDAIPYDSKKDINKNIIIEDNVWIGDRVIILGGTTIGEGAIIQAGSVVVNDIPKYAIAGGHPAKVFSSRDKEHYEKLKSEGKFH